MCWCFAETRSGGSSLALEEIGAVLPKRRGADALKALVASEIEKWTPIIKAAGPAAN
jgi:tripartite-type tricarboxylate transporter receptor subunit TctC